MITKFVDFEFDPLAGQLTRQSEPVDLRPKSMLLLQVLLSRPGAIIEKTELIDAVWGHRHVEDQALFQLISELRGNLGRDCIRTFPGRGYQWAWPVSKLPRPVGDSRGALGPWFAIAAAAFLAIMGLTRSTQESQRQSSSLPPLAAVSPAVDALAKGLDARAAGDLGKAEAYLMAAIAEYPRFASAKLEMAETLRQSNALIRAQGYAYDALSDARLASDAYMEVAAQLLLSQLRWQQGDLTGAQLLNAAAGKLAGERHFVCAAELSTALDKMLISALAKPNQRSKPPTLGQQSLLAGCNQSSMQRTSPPERYSVNWQASNATS